MKKLFLVGSAVFLSMSLIGRINNNVNEGNVAVHNRRKPNS